LQKKNQKRTRLWSWASRGLAPRLTDWRETASRKVTLTLVHESCGSQNQEWVCWGGPAAIYPTNWVSQSWVESRQLRTNCEMVASQQQQVSESSRISIVGNCNRAMTSEGCNRRRLSVCCSEHLSG
jgi:hypothetical protein